MAYSRTRADGFKWCVGCERDLPHDAFYSKKLKSGRAGLHHLCKECWNRKYSKKLRESVRSCYAANPAKYRKIATDARRKKRLAVLEHYSDGTPECACCGESQLKFLTIDHINNDGAAHRRETNGSAGLVNWIIKNNYPPGLQVLCFNCNCAKGFYGSCPHQDAA